MSPMNNRLLRPRASGGFDPRTVANLAFWLDASDASTVSTVNDGTGNGVSEWRSKVSGSSLKATQGSEPNRPYYVLNSRNGRNVVTFDGAADFLIQDNLALNQPFSIVWVGTNSVATSVLCDGRSSAGGSSRVVVYWFSSTQVSYFAGTSERFGTSSVLGQWSVFSVAFNGSSSFMRVNGVQTSSGNPGANNITGTMNLGANLNGTGGFTSGSWGAWLVYSRALSESEFSTVERGMGSLWGVTVA